MTSAFDELRSDVRGRVTTADEPEWDTARGSWNLSVDQRPAAVAEPVDAGDVQAVVRFAARNRLRIAPQATGHGSESLGALDGAILLKTSALRGVTVDPQSGIARAGAGALAGEVADAAGRHGRAPVLGLSPTVGVTGLALGGGTGWLSRAYGLTADNVRAFEVVTPAGERLRADAQTEPDLYWALRGGGGRFAIVTALELDAHPVAEASAGALIWPAEQAADVLGRFRRWTDDAPEALGAVFRYLDLPPLDAVPAPLRGRRVVAVIAAHVAGEDDARRRLEPLRAAGGTIVDTFGPIEPAELVRVAGDPEQPGPARGDGFLIEPLGDAAIGAVAELIAENALAPLAVLELRLLGGALARRADGHGALGRLDGAFSVFAGGPVFSPEMRAANAERLAELRARLAPSTTPQALLNASGGGIDPARAFEPATWERLRRIQDAYDPERMLLANHG
jgi:FAD/FMN-containing dehydrogenase